MVEVKDVNQVTLLVAYNFVAFVVQRHILMWFYHGAEKDLHLIHFLIKSVKLRVSEIVIIHEVPLPTTVLVTITISFTREIDPLWVTEFVTHEVKITLATERLRDKTDHFVKSHASGNLRSAFGQNRHVRVDLCIK